MQQLNLPDKLRNTSTSAACRRQTSTASPQAQAREEQAAVPSGCFDVFRAELWSQLRECRSERDALRRIATLIGQQRCLLGLWFFHITADGTGHSVSLIDREANSLWQLDPGLPQSCTQAVETRQSAQIHCLRLANHVAVAVPVPSESFQQVFCGLMPSAQADNAEGVGQGRVLLELASQYLLLWRCWFTKRQSETFSRFSTAVLSIIGSMSGKVDLPGASLVLVNHFREILDCQRVAIVFRENPAAECKLLAVSGTDAFDPHSALTVSLQAVGRTAMADGETLVWRRTLEDSHSEAVPQLAQRQLADQLQADCILAIPTTNCDGLPNGCLIVAGEMQLAEKGESLCSTNMFGNLIGAQLDLMNLARCSMMARFSKSAVSFVRSNLGRIVLALAAAVALALLVPLPYKIKSECAIQPVFRRFIAAPFDGKLEQTMVQPGNLVQQGDVLARLDGSVIRMELSSLRAQYERESKRCAAALSSGNIAESQIARHEMERIALEIALMEKRMGHLEIQSPITGVVVSGDLQQVEGAPLSVGQSMFEIAPLEQMVVEVFIPEEEIGYVEQGMPVALRTDAFPLSSFSGTITRIHPRSQMQNEQSVFVAELLLDNADASLRPGMNGTAKVRGQRRMLGWILFHKVWEKVIFQCGL